MPTRYRWYRIKLPKGDLDLRRTLLARPLRAGSNFGFAPIGDQPNESDFRFLWRTALIVTRFTPDDEPYHEPVQTIDWLRLSIVDVNKMKFLRIENPIRNLRELMNAIESIVGLGFTCSPVTFEANRPNLFLERVESSRLVVFKIVGAMAGEDVVSRMEFVSKGGIDLHTLPISRKLRYKVDVSVFECAFRGSRGQVSISSSGVVKVSGALAPRLAYLIEKELPTVIGDHGRNPN